MTYNVNHFYDDDDTSNYHTIRASNELVDGGGTTSQAKSNDALCFSDAIPAICLVFMTGLIQSVSDIGLR